MSSKTISLKLYYVPQTKESIPSDMVHNALVINFGEAKASERWTITAQDVPESKEGLLKLLSHDCYRAAVDFTSV